jgi:hypothetical protein
VSRAERRLRSKLDKRVQSELGHLLSLVPDVATPEHHHLAPLLELGLEAVLTEEPNLALATKIREDVSRGLHKGPFGLIRRAFRHGPAPTLVVLGLGTLLYVALPTLFAFMRVTLLGISHGAPIARQVFGMDASPLLLAALAGAVGSAVSIMVRLNDFARLPFRRSDAHLLFLTGLFKPVIGMAFGVFVYAALQSGLIPVKLPEQPSGGMDRAPFFFLVVAFLSGFSERFAGDIASSAEQAVTSADLSATVVAAPTGAQGAGSAGTSNASGIGASNGA